jgi:hypothetical protein
MSKEVAVLYWIGYRQNTIFLKKIPTDPHIHIRVMDYLYVKAKIRKQQYCQSGFVRKWIDTYW